MHNEFDRPDLMYPPSFRAAFSDRQAFVCAVLAKYAYYPFEGLADQEKLVADAQALVTDSAKQAQLNALLNKILAMHIVKPSHAEQVFAQLLGAGGFTLLKTFDHIGAQAFVCQRESQLNGGGTRVELYVVFRGTEIKDKRDIKADLMANLDLDPDFGQKSKVHRGFRSYLDALDRTSEGSLSAFVKAQKFDQLFIVGHSLGGAIAKLFTRKYFPADQASCYTYGAPPVGNQAFQEGLKTPVYEIINETDIVPRLPNQTLVMGTQLLFKFVQIVAGRLNLFTDLLIEKNWSSKIEQRLQQFHEYYHCGYVSYLVGHGKNVTLTLNVPALTRANWYVKRAFKWRLWKQPLTDHSIDQYIEKLRFHAIKRNSESS
ncbi:lipase family protein [Reinekea forsetii]|nr:lipase family protein [Reinekea forsetii]